MICDVIKSKQLKKVPPQKHVCTESAVLNELKARKRRATGCDERWQGGNKGLCVMVSWQRATIKH